MDVETSETVQNPIPSEENQSNGGKNLEVNGDKQPSNTSKRNSKRAREEGSEREEGVNKVCKMVSNPSEPTSTSGITTDVGPGRRKRSRSRGLKTLLMPPGQRKRVELNERGQAIGKEASEFLTWMGTIVRDAKVLPCNYPDWRKVPKHYKEDVWKKVQEKFVIDNAGRRSGFQKMGLQWKAFKLELKANIYERCQSYDECVQKCDARVPTEQWKDLIGIWEDERNQAMCARNKDNRSNLKMSHTAGRRSFAQLQEIKRKENPQGEELSRLEMFIVTRTKKTREPVDVVSQEKMTEFKSRLSQLPEESRNDKVLHEKIFIKVMGNDTHGRVRMYGVGVSKKDIDGPTKTSAQVMRENADLQDKVAALEEQNKMNEEKTNKMIQEQNNIIEVDRKKNADAIASLQSQVEKLTHLLLRNQQDTESSQDSVNLGY